MRSNAEIAEHAEPIALCGLSGHCVIVVSVVVSGFSRTVTATAIAP